MPQADPRMVCTCAKCSTLNPKGCFIPRSTYFSHKANANLRSSIPLSKFRCTYCPDKHPNGHLVSHSTLLRHKKNAGATAPNEPQRPPFAVRDNDDTVDDVMDDVVDDAINDAANEVMDNVVNDVVDDAVENAMDNVTGNAMGDTMGDAVDDAIDNAFDVDGTDNCAHLSIEFDSSTEEESSTEMQ